MIPNLRMGYYQQKEYLERSYNIQMGEKSVKKPLKVSMEGFEYSSLFMSKTYSILSYIVGGFVGSKSQMNNNKHNLSYDLSAAIVNLLNPCKYEREKGYRRSNDSFCNTTSKISAEGYDKYIVKSSQKKKMIDLGLEWFENYVLGFQECYNCSQTKDDLFNCGEDKVSNDSQINLNSSKMEDCLNKSVDKTDQVSVCGVETPENENENFELSVNCVITKRFRQHSECSVESTDSESFIVFDCPDQDDEEKNEKTLKLENFDFDSEDENDDYDDDDDDDDDNDDDDDDDDNCYCDDYDISSINKDLAEANDKWKKNYENMETQDDVQRKVRFNEDVKVNKIVAWDYAYRAARPGPWEQMARDRVRFQERILRLSPIISAILRKEHRDKIFKELYS